MSIDLLARGGPVIWVLLSLSVFALAIILERWIHFLRMGRPLTTLEQALKEAIHSGDMGALLSKVRGPEAAMIRALWQSSQQGIADLTRVAKRVGSEELQRMEQRFRILGMIGNTAPLIGLLGTITGLIKAFMVIEQAGGKVDAQALAGGIWEAMITTGVGLSVAIPILFLLHALEGMAERRAHAMQRYASLMIEALPHSSISFSEDRIRHHLESDSGI